MTALSPSIPNNRSTWVSASCLNRPYNQKFGGDTSEISQALFIYTSSERRISICSPSHARPEEAAIFESRLYVKEGIQEAGVSVRLRLFPD
jgi:hypothetical protein